MSTPDQPIEPPRQLDGVQVGGMFSPYSPPNGKHTPFTSETSKAMTEAKHRDMRALKAKLRERYEDELSEYLAIIGRLQGTILAVAADPSVELSAGHLAKLHLGLKAADQVLNRSLGKPITHVEAKHSHDVVGEMAKAYESWSVEAEMIVDPEEDDDDQ